MPSLGLERVSPGAPAATDVWVPWLRDRLHRLLRRGQGAAAVAMVLEPSTDELHLLATPQDTSSTDPAPFERIARHHAAPLNEVLDGLTTRTWSIEQLDERVRRCLGPSDLVAAAPLSTGERVLGIVAIGYADGRTTPDEPLLAASADGIAEGLALRLHLTVDRANADWRLAVLLHVGSGSGDLHQTLHTLAQRGFATGPFRIVGTVLFDRDPAGPDERVQALEQRNHRDATGRVVPVSLPGIGRLLRRTLAGGQTVSVTPTVRDLYLRDAPALAAFLEARDLTHGVFAPIRAGATVVGAVLAFSDETEPGPALLGRVEELAALTGAAVRSSYALEAVNGELASIRDERDELRRQHERVVELGDRVLVGSSLHELIQELATEVDTPLLVENGSLERLAVAWPAGGPSTALTDQEWLSLTTPLREPATLRALHADDHGAWPYYFPLEEAFPHAAVRVVVPVRVGGDIVGFLSSLREDPAEDVEADRALERAALFVGLGLIREQTAEQVRHELNQDVLDDLLSSRSGESADTRLRRFKREFQPPFFLIVVSWQQHATADNAPNPTARMVTGLAGRALAPLHHASLLFGEKDGSVLLALNTEDERVAVDAAERITAAVERTFAATTCRACVSRRYLRLWELETAYTEASKVLRLSESLNSTGKVVSARELGAYTALLQTDNLHELRDFSEQWLAPLLAYDVERGSDLVETLHAHLRNWGHQRHTAAECSIHISTLKYRLQRITDITDLDLSDPDTRTQTLLACQVLHMISLLAGHPHSDEADEPREPS